MGPETIELYQRVALTRALRKHLREAGLHERSHVGRKVVRRPMKLGVPGAPVDDVRVSLDLGDRGLPISMDALIVIHRFEATHPGPEAIIEQASLDELFNDKARTAFGGANTLLGDPIRRAGDGHRIRLLRE